jgi:hypothetical protein
MEQYIVGNLNDMLVSQNMFPHLANITAPYILSFMIILTQGSAAVAQHISDIVKNSEPKNDMDELFCYLAFDAVRARTDYITFVLKPADVDRNQTFTTYVYNGHLLWCTSHAEMETWRSIGANDTADRVLSSLHREFIASFPRRLTSNARKALNNKSDR